MNQANFAYYTETLAQQIVDDINTTVAKQYDVRGPEIVNACFGNALAMAVGNVLSAYCFMHELDRKETFIGFHEVCKDAGKRHKEWKLSKSEQK